MQLNYSYLLLSFGNFLDGSEFLEGMSMAALTNKNIPSFAEQLVRLGSVWHKEIFIPCTIFGLQWTGKNLHNDSDIEINAQRKKRNDMSAIFIGVALYTPQDDSESLQRTKLDRTRRDLKSYLLVT